MSHLKLKIIVLFLTLFAVVPAVSAEHIIHIYDFSPKTKRMDVFEPEFLKIVPGDTVRWIPQNQGHDTVSLRGMIPQGAESWESEISQEFSHTFTVTGVYAYECSPHFKWGMAGVIQVGDTFTNKDTFMKNIQRFKGMGGKKIRKIIEDHF